MNYFNEGGHRDRANLPYNIAGIVGIIVILVSMASFFSFTVSVFKPIPVTETAEPSIIFSVDDFFNLINAGRYDIVNERYAYTEGNLKTMVDQKISKIFPKGSIDRAEVSSFKVGKNSCTASLKVYLKNGGVLDYKEPLKMYKNENREWKIDCSNIDDPSFWH